MRLVCLFIVLVSLLLFTAGCNTVEGFGKDMEGAGKQIQKWAK